MVSPSFAALQAFIIDTLIESNKITLALPTGDYEWRIRAENTASETEYLNAIFTIERNLQNTDLSLTHPEDEFATNESDITFQWDTLDNAIDYTIHIATDENLIDLIQSQTLTDNEWTTNFNDGTYYWQVTAYNNLSSMASDIRQLTIDTQAPEAPTLLSPENEAIITTLIANLQWQRDTDAEADSLFIYEGSITNEPIVATKTTDTTYPFTPSTNTYFWRLKSIDAAQNESNFSQLFSFTKQ